MKAIEILNLEKKFGDLIAVDNLSLDIEEGQLFGLLGPNGAGKTTTLRMLTGILRPTAGGIKISGIDMLSYPEKCKEQIGYLPESPILYDYLSISEFLSFIGRIKKVEDSVLENRIEELSKLFNLEKKLDNYVGSLSHGMRQKVAIITALINSPKVLLLDEPYLGLDPKSQKDFKNLLHKNADDGCTALLSTHILDVAEKLCSKVGIVHRGKILATGTLDELREVSKSTEGASLEDVFLKLTEESKEA
jgi:ABC-2 type transport system ATP-binding protein